MVTDTPRRQLHAPRYWPTWLGAGVLWCLSRLPYPMAMGAGSVLGWFGYWLARYRRHIAEVNIDLCFPELTTAQRRRLVRRNLRYTGRGLVEVSIAWWADGRRIDRLSHIRGLEHIQRARAEGRGIILLGAHFTPLDLTGRILRRHIPFQVIYRENRNPVIEHLMRENRRRHYEHAFDRNDMRALLRALRQRGIVWYPPDQDYGRHHTVFAPFFGIPAATITLPARLARMTGAVVIPAFGYAREDGRGYDIEIQPPLEHFPSGNDTADAARVNALIEAAAREHPAQYYWVHRRFKTRPAGEPRPYTRERRRRRRAHP